MIIHWKLLKALNISVLNPSPCHWTYSSFNILNCSLKQSFLFCSGNPLRERWPHKPGPAAGGELVLLSSQRLQRRAGTTVTNCIQRRGCLRNLLVVVISYVKGLNFIAGTNTVQFCWKQCIFILHMHV